MSAIAPFARLINMLTGAVVATTSNLESGTVRHIHMDAASELAVSVLLADAGDATGNALPDMQPFAATLLSGAGPGATPLLLSLSWDGGATWDSHKLVDRPMQDIHMNALTLTESGEDVFSVYATVPAGGGGLVAAECALADLLGANEGTIKPLPASPGIFSADGTLSLVTGLFNPTASICHDVPGNPAWNSSALALLRFTPVVGHDIDFDIPTLLETTEDNVQHALTILIQRLNVLLLGRGAHWVADASDSALNVAGRFAGTVCDGTPTATGTFGSSPPGPSGAFGLSNARTSGHEVARSVVIGYAGTSPVLTFDGDTQAAVIDETTTAFIEDGATIEQDANDALHGQVSFTGGSSNAGFPSGATITGMTLLNRQPSGNRDAWTDNLCILSLNVSDTTGGAYYWANDGQLRPISQSFALPTYDLLVDTHFNKVDVATDRGVFNHSTDVTDPTEQWVAVGGLTAKVTRLAGVPVGTTDFKLYALATGNTNNDQNGVYVYDPAHSVNGAGADGWVPLLSSSDVLDMVSTDDHSFWYLDRQDPGAVLLYDFDAALAQPVTTRFPLPDGVKALRLDRVLTTAQDTVYVATAGVEDLTGNAYVGYYASYNTGTNSWQTNQLVGSDLELHPIYLTVGQALRVSRFIGPNQQINPDKPVFCAVMACTEDGIYASTTNTPTSAGDWFSTNEQNGLSGISITNAFCGEWQHLLGQQVSRIYATSQSDLYVSHNNGDQYQLVSQGNVDLAPYFSNLAQTITADLPGNSIASIGPTAPSGVTVDGLDSRYGVNGSGTRVHIYCGTDILPSGFYWARRLNQEGAFVFRLVNTACPFTNLMKDQLSNVVANEAITTLTASSMLAVDMRRWLAENSVPQTILTIPSRFTQTNAALRGLTPLQLVHVTLHGTMACRSSTGAIVGYQYVDYQDAPFYVLDHQEAVPQEGSPYIATSTQLGTVLRSAPFSPADVADSLQEQLIGLKNYAMRSVKL